MKQMCLDKSIHTIFIGTAEVEICDSTNTVRHVKVRAIQAREK